MPRTLAPAALTVRNALTRNRLLPAGGDPPSSYLTFTTIVRATCLIRNPKTSLADPAGSDRTAAGRIESLNLFSTAVSTGRRVIVPASVAGLGWVSTTSALGDLG